MPIVLNRFFKFATIFILLITCTSCEIKESYTNKMWLKELALGAMIGDYNQETAYFKNVSENDETYVYIQSLVEWGVLQKTDVIDFDDELRFDFIVYTLTNLLSNKTYSYHEINQTIIDEFNRYNLYDINKYHFKGDDIINKEIALNILKKALYIINNQTFVKTNDVKYKDEDDKSLDSIEYLKLSDSLEVDFDEVYIEDIYEISNDKSIYNDDIYQRRTHQLLSKTFEHDGYKISYSANKHRLHFRVSKKTDRGLNLYFDGDVFNLKTSYQFEMEKHKIKNAYFKINYQTSEELGFEQSKLPRLYGDLSSLDDESLFARLKSLFKSREDVVDTSFTVCKIHIPIKELPSAEIVLELKLNIYVGGKVEFALSSSHQNGFEIKNGRMRIINDDDYDGDFIINASASTSVGLKVVLKFLETNLMDINSRAGIKALAKTTLHLYDSEGKLYSENAEMDYDTAKTLTNNHNTINVCADLSLYWLFNVTFNDEGTLAYTLGLHKNIDILDEDNQIFGNLSHIENGLFKEKCSYLSNRNQVNDNENTIVKTDRIILDVYSVVVKNDAKDIIINSLPNDYQMSDICYEVENKEIARVENHKIYMIKPGVTKIRIYTSDNKYEVYLNVLVSDG